MRKALDGYENFYADAVAKKEKLAEELKAKFEEEFKKQTEILDIIIAETSVEVEEEIEVETEVEEIEQATEVENATSY